MTDKTLIRIAELLNTSGALWAVGGSLVLNHYGLGDPPNDIDLLVDLKDAERVNAILSLHGEKKPADINGTYSTRYFSEYVIDGTEIDVISGLMINHDKGCYGYSFRQDSISETISMGSTHIPLMALEDWYVLYQLIPGREMKVKLIEDYLKTHGITRKDLLDRSLRGQLPDTVRRRIEQLLQE